MEPRDNQQTNNPIWEVTQRTPHRRVGRETGLARGTVVGAGAATGPTVATGTVLVDAAESAVQIRRARVTTTTGASAAVVAAAIGAVGVVRLLCTLIFSIIAEHV